MKTVIDNGLKGLDKWSKKW